MTKAEFANIVKGKRFAFVNAWRNIDRENPVLRKPLAMMDPKSTNPDEWLLYELVRRCCMCVVVLVALILIMIYTKGT